MQDDYTQENDLRAAEADEAASAQDTESGLPQAVPDAEAAAQEPLTEDTAAADAPQTPAGAPHKRPFWPIALLVLVLAAVLIAAAWKLIGGRDKTPSGQDPAPTPSAQNTPDALPATVHEGLTYSVTGIYDDAPVASLGGSSATADMFTYWLGNNYSYWDYVFQSYTGTGLSMDGTVPDGRPATDFLYEESVRMLRQQLVLEELAVSAGVTLPETAESELAQQRADTVSALGGEAGYRAELAKLGVSETTYERLRRAEYLYSALYQNFLTPGSRLYPSEEELLSYANELGYISADHILLMTTDQSTGTALDETTVAEKRAQAEDILAQLRASDDPEALFTELADRYSEDPGHAVNPTGYTFTTGEMVKEFEDAAYALGEGEISDIVETSYGYHILLRRPLNEEAAIDAVREPFFSSLVTAMINEANVSLDPALEQVDCRALLEALLAAQAG